MADPIDVAKDVSIAFLSASALLLTLILGFISPTLPKGASVTLIQLATLFLFACAGESALSLKRLVKSERVSTKLYDVMFLTFLFGLGLIAIAIVIVSTK